MRLAVRDCVRSMRDRFKVVEWGFFLDELKKKGIDNPADVADALHFLANIGELSYFGDVSPPKVSVWRCFLFASTLAYLIVSTRSHDHQHPM